MQIFCPKIKDSGTVSEVEENTANKQGCYSTHACLFAVFLHNQHTFVELLSC